MKLIKKTATFLFIIAIVVSFSSSLFAQAAAEETTPAAAATTPAEETASAPAEEAPARDLNAELQQKIDQANTHIQKANELHNAGEYDLAYAEAEKAKSLTVEINQLKEQLAKKDGAQSKINEAKSLIEKAENMQADKYAQEELAKSKSSLLSAENSYAQNNYADALKSAEESVGFAQECLTKIDEVKKQEEEGALTKSGETPETSTTASKTESPEMLTKGNFKLKTTYKVRLIPERRDCLWRIAEYKYIYDNPWKWPVIYKANKDQIKDPDLIFPGQVFAIPELDEKGNPVVVEKGTTTEKEVIEKEVPANDTKKDEIPGK